MSDSRERMREEFEKFVAPEKRYFWLWNLWQQAFLLGERAATSAALENAAQPLENYLEQNVSLKTGTVLRRELEEVLNAIRALKPAEERPC